MYYRPSRRSFLRRRNTFWRHNPYRRNRGAIAPSPGNFRRPTTAQSKLYLDDLAEQGITSINHYDSLDLDQKERELRKLRFSEAKHYYDEYESGNLKLTYPGEDTEDWGDFTPVSEQAARNYVWQFYDRQCERHKEGLPEQDVATYPYLPRYQEAVILLGQDEVDSIKDRVYSLHGCRIDDPPFEGPRYGPEPREYDHPIGPRYGSEPREYDHPIGPRYGPEPRKVRYDIIKRTPGYAPSRRPDYDLPDYPRLTGPALGDSPLLLPMYPDAPKSKKSRKTKKRRKKAPTTYIVTGTAVPKVEKVFKNFNVLKEAGIKKANIDRYRKSKKITRAKLDSYDEEELIEAGVTPEDAAKIIRYRDGEDDEPTPKMRYNPRRNRGIRRRHSW